ncbi:MAG: fatty acyl-AMP ligase [Tatlockia sp.]|jgi:acyl-CoA synthetase (AMP-forming)/AMP-acid ligase II|nr:fatty acyl-AMP ligase [Tatlockia sp.]
MVSFSLSSNHTNYQLPTLIDLLRWRAVHNPNQRAYTFLNGQGAESESLTYRELDQSAMAIASLIQHRKIQSVPILLLYPPCLEFIAAFFGCLYAGALAVPLYPPKNNQFNERLLAISIETQARIALTMSSMLPKTSAWAANELQLRNLEWIATDTIDGNETKEWRNPKVKSEDLAFLQYTSGSTAMPKGIMLSHANLAYNQQMIKHAFEHSEKSTVLGWLPLYHDMGLIGNILQPLYVGIPCFLMSPMTFLLKPYRWLEAISRYKVTTSGAPDFAYDLCVNKITPEQSSTLDLSGWDLAFSGSEPVRFETIERFSKAFAPYGFRRESFYPCYGLAEATLLVSGGIKADAPVVHQIEPEATEFAEPCPVASLKTADNTFKLVGCGAAKLDERVIIVEPKTFTICPEGVSGEIWVSGHNVAQGYWNRPKETEETFRVYTRDTKDGPFLRTGDLGFIKDGELFIKGRIKDIIIIRGCNHYPQDIEATVESSNLALKSRSGAAFSIELKGKEKLIIVQEVGRNYARLDDVAADIRQAVAEKHDLQVYAIVFLKAGSIPRTSSGKIRRFKCKTGFLEQTLNTVGTFYSGQLTANFKQP